MANQDILAWSAALAAVAFVVLCGFTISLLLAAKRSLAVARSAMREAKETVESLQAEVKKLTDSVNEATNDVRDKLRSASPLFDAVQDVGILLSEMTGTAREAGKSIARAIRYQAAAMEGGTSFPSWLRLALAAAEIAMEARGGRRSDADASVQPNKEVE
ncbi:DUF948 domain-containing protein [Paenibacillaceae bacterium WGS1546]|uniref:DUF948 domain-containing protein n=1 Tax=Cohnella sp. WGS1546 TaxID=3366810 RepID=UPI00372D33FD